MGYCFHTRLTLHLLRFPCGWISAWLRTWFYVDSLTTNHNSCRMMFGRAGWLLWQWMLNDDKQAVCFWLQIGVAGLSTSAGTYTKSRLSSLSCTCAHVYNVSYAYCPALTPCTPTHRPTHPPTHHHSHTTAFTHLQWVDTPHRYSLYI